ncbi:hypothetical protein ACFQ0M_00560 [Kitasatospora aburaviensis]
MPGIRRLRWSSPTPGRSRWPTGSKPSLTCPPAAGAAGGAGGPRLQRRRLARVRRRRAGHHHHLGAAGRVRPDGPVWWRYGRDEARYSLLDALESPDTREAYDERQEAGEEKARQVHRELMRTLACADCGNVPTQESTLEYGPQGRQGWTRCPGGRCWSCHEKE